jgi:hypothetical protein
MPTATYFGTKVPFFRNTLYTLTRDTTYASAGRDPFASHIVTDVCIHNTEYINNCELIPEEAHYSLVLLSLQYELGLFNLCRVGLINLCNLEILTF